MIVKVQIPVVTNDPNAMALVYNEDRSFDVFMPITKDLKKAMGDNKKQYFHAEYDKKNNNTILKGKAPWQSW